MKILFRLFVYAILICLSQIAYSSQILFYTDNSLSNSDLSNKQIINLFDQHANKIDIIAPQIYQVAKNGVVWGSIDPKVLTIAKKNHVKVMPLAINEGFNQQNLHVFLTHQDAMTRAIQSLVMLCKKHGYFGIQFDFENISINDKDLYTNFIKQAAQALHNNNYEISVTIVPHVPLASIQNQYDKFILSNWSGAYNEKALASFTDFITIMAYDRHTSYTTPGPIAPINWVKQIIKNVLLDVPANKVSLGIPIYSGFWTTSKTEEHYQGKEHQISFNDAMYFIEKNKLTPRWDKNSMSASVINTNSGKGLYQYLYLENARSFSAKFSLVKQFHLKGISVWQLGFGDPRIWKELPSRLHSQ